MEDFKPFAYVYRLEKDNKLSELNRLKKLRVYLCTEIEASFVHLGKEHSFSISDYEYITLENRNHFLFCQ